MFRWIKQYMPKRLYWRAAIILLFPVIFLQLIISVVIIKRHFEGVTEQMTRTVASQIELIATTVEKTKIETALNLSKSLNMELFKIGTTDQKVLNRRRFYDVSGIVVIRELYDLKWVQNVDLLDDDYVTVTLKLAEMDFQLRFERARVSASNPHQLIVNMVVFGAFFTLIAFVYLRNQLRPITRLASAAEAFGRGQTVPYSASGAIEVKAAGNAFLEMRNRIERHIEQRTMILSGVSHDLRTPLTRLKLGISMLEIDDKEPLERDLEEMNLMLDEFLTFAKAQDTEKSNFELLSVSSVIESIESDYRRSGAKLDIVDNKKPAPDVYLLAAKELGVDPDRCWVIEDSEIGCKAGKAAGMKVVVTKSIYTENENFDGAEAVIKDLDNGLDGPITATYLNYKSSDRAYKAKKATENADLFGASPDMNNMVKKMLSGDMGKGMKM